jgi:Divergent InlB B-repeat domain
LAFSNPHKKYLVYYDGPVEQPNVCGTAGGQPTTGPSYAFVYIRACGADPVGEGALWADVAVHELVHALGVVPQGAPNACAGNSGHVCDSNSDLMFPSTAGESLESIFLDVGRNDYYGHAGSWFDLQDSGWLARLDVPLHPLTVTLEGGGTGRVDSDLPGIECPPACSIPWEAGTQVGLRATPGAGSRFAGWSGACSGTGACAVPINAPASVTARFTVPVDLAVRVVSRGGAGSVVSEPPGLDCADACSVRFDAGQVVRLRAVPEPGSRFLGWGGACAGRGVCTLTVAAGQTVTAAFGRASFLVTVRKTGQGRVASRPGGISCGSRCTAPFRAGTAVRLVARAAPGWRFVSWTGACRGRGACVVRATADRAVRATFRR